jgi:hypothetical protein
VVFESEEDTNGMRVAEGAEEYGRLCNSDE